MDKKILFFSNQFFERVDMRLKRVFSGLGCLIACIGFLPDKLFFNSNVTFAFECLDMTREIAVGHTEQFLERAEISRLVDHQDRHDAKPDAVVKRLIDMLDDVLHKLYLSALVFKMHDAAVNDVADTETECPEFERIS